MECDCLASNVQAFIAGALIIGGGLVGFFWWKGWLKFK